MKKNCDEIFAQLKTHFAKTIQENGLSNKSVAISCRQLSAKEAIGEPEHTDYPIIKGKEVMVEADFLGAKGQAFSDEYENRTYTLDEVMAIPLQSNAQRASFIAAFNAVYRYLGLPIKTIHCKDAEPVTCAETLIEILPPLSKILLVGFQPRFLDYLSRGHSVRVVDMDPDHVNQYRFGVLVEPVEMTESAIAWCDIMLVTGSTLVNGTLVNFLDRGKPVWFYGTTIAAAANVLSLSNYCECGR